MASKTIRWRLSLQGAALGLLIAAVTPKLARGHDSTWSHLPPRYISLSDLRKYSKATSVPGHQTTFKDRASLIDEDEVQGIRPVNTTPEWVVEAMAVLAEVVQQFLSGLTPDIRGMERPNAMEYQLDHFVKRLGQSNFQFMMHGVGNLKPLGDPYFFNEIQGGVGIEYRLFALERYGTVVSIRVSPAHIEYAFVRYGAGAGSVESNRIATFGTASEIPQLPQAVTLGPAFGIEIAQTIFGAANGAIQPGIRGYASPQIDLLTIGSPLGPATGWSWNGAAYCRINLNDLFKLKNTPPMNIQTILSATDRGDAKRSVYEGLPTSAETHYLRRVIQAMTLFELKL